ncbi:MAG: beta-propeller domain-containing protein [Thiolinea sp.]
MEYQALPAAIPEVGRGGSQSMLTGQTLYLENREDIPYQLTLLLAIDLDAATTRLQAAAYPGYVQNLYVSDKAIYLTSGYYSGAALASRSVPISTMSSQLIHKFALRGKGFDYRGSGLVLGDFGWNESSTFQMDEDSKGNLRVVTFNWARTNSHPDPVTRCP